ncbi:GNAT family N-acetyltransferase [Kordiimonas sp. SCSIO 12610]|uniref:GNAT family N-acetyltransferase n=1 Tax=Kordiimonas sp. SCSIO 12610 TaxID=2829597 RepID=UPI00210D9F50|nr:GNAT family N-acetyltransferase [Kordiimonas sp. SCSIO 12610]UTW55107.1 GNAT family N-acetyltransferase [Kordiimonas sp. SCSIO 12610]
MSTLIDFAINDVDVAAVKAIFKAYTDWIPIDLEFQGLADEFANFPDGYEFLLLAKQNSEPIGAVALKRHDDNVCEMKRLFVYPHVQRSGAGEALSIRLIAEAKKAGYQKMLLDSLRRLEPAVALYKKLGFQEVEPYNFNPEDDVVYMELLL